MHFPLKTTSLTRAGLAEGRESHLARTMPGLVPDRVLTWQGRCSALETKRSEKMYAGELKVEARWAEEEERIARLEAERRFSPPPGCCPWGCDGSGWKELSCFGDVQPEPGYDIFWEGQWWTPCECNLASTHLNGERFVCVRRYPDGYIIQEGGRT